MTNTGTTRKPDARATETRRPPSKARALKYIHRFEDVPRRPKRARRYALALQAGGSAKTTTAICVAYEMGQRGRRVLLIDLDSQCNASEISGYEPDEAELTVFDVLQTQMRQRAEPVTLSDAIVPARYVVDIAEELDEATGEARQVKVYETIPGVDIVPGHALMDTAEALLTSQGDAMFWLRVSLDALEEELGYYYDVILLDCPAAYGKLTASVFASLRDDEIQDQVLPPIKATSKDSKAVSKLEKKLAEINEHPILPMAGCGPRLRHVVICEYPTSTHNAAEYWDTVEEVTTEYGPLLLPHIRWSAHMARVHRYALPVGLIAPGSDVAQDVRKLVTAMGYPAQPSPS